MTAVALVVAGVTVARFATLDLQSFTFDETLTVRLSEMSFGDMLGEMPDIERNPPLYYVVIWPWAQLAGTGEVALRIPSAVFATATVAIAFLVGRRLLGEAGALIATVLIAVNPWLFWYSQEARAYALYALVASLSLLYFVRLLTDPTPRHGWAFALWSAVAVCTHYFAIFLIVPETAWLLWRRRIRLHQAAVPAVAALLLLPLALAQGAGGGQFAEGEYDQRTMSVVKQLLVGLELDTPVEAALKVAAVLALVVAVAAWSRGSSSERQRIGVAFALAAAVVFVPAVLATVGFDYFNSRNVLAAVVPLMIALAGAYAIGRARPWAASGVALLCVAGVVSVGLTLTDTFPQREDWRSLAQALGSDRSALVVTPGDGEPYDAYPLDAYLDEVEVLPARGTCVEDVAVAALPVRAGRKVAWSAIPRRERAPKLPGFQLVDRDVEETFVLFRYRAPELRRVTPDTLLELRRDPEENGAVLMTGSGAGGLQQAGQSASSEQFESLSDCRRAGS
jgi:mannosyltransferase